MNTYHDDKNYAADIDRTQHDIHEVRQGECVFQIVAVSGIRKNFKYNTLNELLK